MHFLKNIKKHLFKVSILAAAAAAIALPLTTISAKTEYHHRPSEFYYHDNKTHWTEMLWLLEGHKNIDGMDFTNRMDGVTKATWWFFAPSHLAWSGRVNAWQGPEGHEIISEEIETDIHVWANGSSAAWGFSTSGFQLSLSSDSHGKTYDYRNYFVDNQKIYYSYSGRIWHWNFVGQNVSSTFKTHNSWVVVNAEVDNSKDWRTYR